MSRPRSRGTVPLLLAVVLAAAALIPAAPATSGATHPRGPDILLVVTDDQRFDSLGNCLPAYGAPDGPGSVPCMPNVRRLLAEKGVTFRSGYATTAH